MNSEKRNILYHLHCFQQCIICLYLQLLFLGPSPDIWALVDSQALFWYEAGVLLKQSLDKFFFLTWKLRRYRSPIAVFVLPHNARGLCIPVVLPTPGSQHKHPTVLEGSTDLTLFDTFQIQKKSPHK